MNLETSLDRATALTVACPLCRAAVDRPCRNVKTGDELARLPAHDARLKAAGVTHAPIDARELARDPHRTRRTR